MTVLSDLRRGVHYCCFLSSERKEAPPLDRVRDGALCLAGVEPALTLPAQLPRTVGRCAANYTTSLSGTDRANTRTNVDNLTASTPHLNLGGGRATDADPASVGLSQYGRCHDVPPVVL